MLTYTAGEVAKKISCPYATLMSWVSHEMLNPQNARAGRRIETVWRAKDVREASVLNNLRRSGFSLQEIKKALAYLRGLGHNPMSTGEFIVVRNGRGEPKDIVKFCDTNEAMNLVKDRGQLVLPLWGEDME